MDEPLLRRRPAVKLLRGLRARLILAFVLVAFVSGGAGSAATFLAARTAVLTDAQQSVLITTRDELNLLALTMSFPPDQAELDRLNAALPPMAYTSITYGRLHSPAGGHAVQVPAELRERVHRDNRVIWQRIRVGGTPYLAFGIPVNTAAGGRSGVEMYGLADLGDAEDEIGALAWSAGRITAIAVLAAVVLALLAARGVLLPVRELRRGARGLAAGRLDTRLPVRGRDELADLVQTFNDTATELERNVAELRRMEEQARRFAADVAHELRTPLAAMTAVTDTLDEEAPNLSGDAGIAARLVSAETRRLAALVENLMEISRFDAGRAVLRADEVDLAELVAATLAARGWTGQVGTDVPAGLTATLDRARIDVVLANLVGNALQHGAPPVTVSAAPLGDDRIAVRVADHGAGVPAEVAGHVFDRFFKADSSRARSEGSGLGLAIAKENALLHGGSVEVGTAESGGAVFTLVLPREGPA